MSTSIAFTDATGAASLDNGKPGGMGRFMNWTPDLDTIGAYAETVGGGVTHAFTFRDDYVASLELPYLRPAKHAVALRLIRHLRTGGTCTVTTGDTSANVYTCRLAPGSRPRLSKMEGNPVEHVLSLALKNTAAAPLLCLY